MKFIRRIFPFLIIGLLAFTFNGCSDDDGDGIPDALSAKLTCNIDGQAWTSLFRATVISDSKITITATTGITQETGELLVITVFGTEQGTYQLASGEVECAAVYKKTATASSDDAYVAANGNVTITEIDTVNKRISGTFNFTVTRITETFSISNGVFQGLKYTQSTSED